MKWKKFLLLEAKYPFLAKDFTWRGAAPPDIKQFVRTRVGFIAFRPFEKLDLSATYSSTSSPLPSPYLHVKIETYVATSYDIWFHVEGEGEGTRLRYVSENSIRAQMIHVMKWFEGCETYRGRRIIWERVVKRTVSGSHYTGLRQMNMEIYLFPEGYQFEPTSEAELPEVQVALRA